MCIVLVLSLFYSILNILMHVPLEGYMNMVCFQFLAVVVAVVVAVVLAVVMVAAVHPSSVSIGDIETEVVHHGGILEHQQAVASFAQIGRRWFQHTRREVVLDTDRPEWIEM